jgi:hypothetical protein
MSKRKPLTLKVPPFTAAELRRLKKIVGAMQVLQLAFADKTVDVPQVGDFLDEYGDELYHIRIALHKARNELTSAK